MSVVIESLEQRSLLSASPALADLRADVATFKLELAAVKKSLQAEIKVLTADLKREKASQLSKNLLTKSFASSVTVPEGQVTKSLGTLVTKASSFVSAADVYSKRITPATTARYTKAQQALAAAFGSENTLAGELYGTRLGALSTQAISLSTATGDPTTESNAGVLTGTVTADISSLTTAQATIAEDEAALGSNVVA